MSLIKLDWFLKLQIFLFLTKDQKLQHFNVHNPFSSTILLSFFHCANIIVAAKISLTHVFQNF